MYLAGCTSSFCAERLLLSTVLLFHLFIWFSFFRLLLFQFACGYNTSFILPGLFWTTSSLWMCLRMPTKTIVYRNDLGTVKVHSLFCPIPSYCMCLCSSSTETSYWTVRKQTCNFMVRKLSFTATSHRLFHFPVMSICSHTPAVCLANFLLTLTESFLGMDLTLSLIEWHCIV